MFDEGMIAKTYLPSRIRFIPTKKPLKHVVLMLSKSS